MKARSAECSLSQSHITSENKAMEFKRQSWVNDEDLVLMNDQIKQLNLTQQRAIETIGTLIYGNRIIKG